MAKHFHLPVPSFFPHHISRELKELFWSRAIMDFAVAAVALFEPIYLYTLGYSLQVILLFYIEVYIVYFILLPVGAKFANRFGYEHSMTLSTIFLVGYYLALYAIGSNPIFLVIPRIQYLSFQTNSPQMGRFGFQPLMNNLSGRLRSLRLHLQIVLPS